MSASDVGAIDSFLAHGPPAPGDAAPSMITGASLILVLSVLAVILRLVARRIRSMRLEADDVLVIVSLVLLVGLFINLILALRSGLGKHISQLSFSQIHATAEYLYIFECIDSLCNAATKTSALLLYRRIFGTTHNILFNRCTIVIGLLWLGVGIAGTLCEIFQCHRIADAWESFHFHGCIDLSAMVLTLTIVGILLNMAILILPIPFMVRLRLDRGTKTGVIILFLLGGADVAVSIVRASRSKSLRLVDVDYTWSQTVTVMLAFLEPSLGIICTCLVIMKPIGTRITSFIFEIKKSIKSSVTQSITTFHCNGIPTISSEKPPSSSRCSKDSSKGKSAPTDPTVSEAKILRFFAKPLGMATTKGGTTFQDTDIHIISHFSVSSDYSDLESLKEVDVRGENLIRETSGQLDGFPKHLAKKALPALPPEAYRNINR